MAISWCIPSWYRTASSASAASKNTVRFGVAGCSIQGDIVPCDPEMMRVDVQRQLREAGLYAQGQELPMDVYILARNMASEAGTQSVTAKVAVADVGITRAKGVGLRQALLKNGQWFGKQRGNNPPVATSQDPSWEDITVAEIVVSGLTRGFAQGATHYLSPRYLDDPQAMYDKWTGKTSGRPEMAWVGHLPYVVPTKMMFFQESGWYRGGGRKTWQQSYEAGTRAIVMKSAPRAPSRACTERLAQAPGSGPIAWIKRLFG